MVQRCRLGHTAAPYVALLLRRNGAITLLHGTACGGKKQMFSIYIDEGFCSYAAAKHDDQLTARLITILIFVR